MVGPRSRARALMSGAALLLLLGVLAAAPQRAHAQAAAPQAPQAVPNHPSLLSLGCWQDDYRADGSRMLPNNYNGADVDSSGRMVTSDPLGECMNFALSQNNAYFGLQYGGQCFSGTDYQDYSAALNGSLSLVLCKSYCPTNSYDYCGSNYKNMVFQIVPVCPAGTSAAAGTVTCAGCPAGTFSSTGASCAPCAANFVSSANASSCSPVPVLSYSFSGSLADSTGTNTLVSSSIAPAFVADRCGVANQAVTLSNGISLQTASNVGVLPTGDMSRTEMAWIRCTASAGSSTRAITQFGTAATGQNSAMVINDNGVNFYTEGGDVFSSSPAVCRGAEWVHIAAMYDASAHLASVWINGQQIANTSISSPRSTTASPFRVGAYPGYNNGVTFQGDIDSAAVYSVALTKAQVQAIASAPCPAALPCSLSDVLTSLPSNSLAGNCSSTLSVGTACTLACVSPYQVPTGARYSCSASGVLSGGQVCADPVCTATSTGSEVVVPVGCTYTGPASAALGSFISVSASLPFPGLLAAPDAVGSLLFDGPGAVPCAANTAVMNAASFGQCSLGVPPSGASFLLTATFSYQRDWCTKFVGTVATNITMVDLAAVQMVAAAAKASTAAETVRAVAAESALNQSLSSEASARVAGDAALAASVASEAAVRASKDAALNASVLAETAARVMGDATLAASVSSESARALRVESSLATNATLLTARVVALETAQSSFLFAGLSTGVTVAYPVRQQPGSGVANMLNQRIVFDAPLSSRGSAISYNASSGVASISEPGSYRLDAFVHLYTPQGSSVGTGVVSWMSVGAAPAPLGANILNPSASGVPQGTVGDDTFVSTLINVPAGTTAALPFTAQCVLISMNQRTNTITDASVIAITKLK